MKRLIAMILAAMLSISGTLTAFAEDANNNQPTQMGSRPPEMPEGGMPGGIPPDGEHGGLFPSHGEPGRRDHQPVGTRQDRKRRRPEKDLPDL